MMLRDDRQKRVQEGKSQNNWNKLFVLACILRRAAFRGGVLSDFTRDLFGIVCDYVLYARTCWRFCLYCTSRIIKTEIRGGYEKDSEV